MNLLDPFESLVETAQTHTHTLLPLQNKGLNPWNKVCQLACECNRKAKHCAFMVSVINRTHAINSLYAIADGVSVAKQKGRTLFACVCEPFYIVNPKAQKRVPVPEGEGVAPRNFDPESLILRLQVSNSRLRLIVQRWIDS
jgi:hypothetical protein